VPRSARPVLNVAVLTTLLVSAFAAVQGSGPVSAAAASPVQRPHRVHVVAHASPKPNHIAMIHPAAHGRAHFARRLFGIPGHLTRSRTHGPRIAARPTLRRGSIPVGHRPTYQGSRVRKATSFCPSGGWSCLDVGAESPSISVASPFTITGGGPGIYSSVTPGHSSTEGFAFVYQSESGDFSLSAEDAGQTSTGSSKDYSNGLMLRSGTGQLQANYHVYVVGTDQTGGLQGGIYVDYTAAGGGTPVQEAMLPVSGSATPGSGYAAATCKAGGSANCYLAIERRTAPDGTRTLEAYWSKDGSHWQAIAESSVTLHPGDALYSGGDAGVAVTSDTSGSSSTATMSAVSISTSSLLDEFPAECPAGFQCAPVGGISKRGQWSVPGNSFASSPWTINGGGAGLVNGNTSDGFHWDYQPLSGDGSVSTTVGPGYEWYGVGGQYGIAQYGVMIRGSTASNAPYFAVSVSPCQGVVVGYRQTGGGAATVGTNSVNCTTQGNDQNGLSYGGSIQLMVERTGSSYQAYQSSGGNNWTTVGSAVTITTIPAQAPAGPFVASMQQGWSSWANFSSVTVSSDVPTGQELLGSGPEAEALSSGSFTDPGNRFTGNYSTTSSDLSISGRGLPLELDRTYNSLLAGQTASTISPYGNLGPGWTDSYDVFTTADTSGNVTVHQGDGGAVTFTDNGGTYTPPTRVLATLTTNAGSVAPNCPTSALVMTLHDRTKLAFYQITGTPPAGQPSGALCEELDINGYPTELTYNSADTQLTTVTECTTVSGTTCGTNRTLSFAYGNGSYPNAVTSVTSSANAGTGTLKVSFSYNGSGFLATSADADGNTTRYAYNAEGLLDQIQTPNQYSAQSAGTQVWYDTSGRVRYVSDAAAVAAGYTGISAYGYQCSYPAGTCSTDGTQTSTAVDANGHETQDIFVDGLRTSETRGVGSPQQATWNYTVDANTLGDHTTTEPAGGSGASYLTSYTDWFGVGTFLGDVQCTVDPGNPGPTVNVTTATWSNNTATLSFGSTTAPVIGATIVVSGVANPAYDGTFQVTGSSGTTVQYALTGSPGSSSGGSFFQVQGNVTSFTYSSNYPSLVATTANPLENAVSYDGTCPTSAPTYDTTVRPPKNWSTLSLVV